MGTRIRLPKTLGTLLAVGLILVLPLKTYAVPIIETGPIDFIHSVFGFPVATIDIRVFDQGVNDPDPVTGDTRFDLISPFAAPGANDYTYFYRLTNLGPFDLASLRIPLPVIEGVETITSAGIIDGAGNVVMGDPAITFNADPLAIIFDLGPLPAPPNPDSVLDLFIISAFSPYDDQGEIKDIGASINAGGSALANIVAPDAYDGVTAVPEPGTLLLLGSGLLGLAGLSRSRLMRQMEKKRVEA